MTFKSAGAAGLIVSMNRILTKALMPDEPRANTIIFFVLSITMIVFCCVIFHSTRRMDFVRYYVNMCKNAGIADDQRGITAVVNNPEEVSLVRSTRVFLVYFSSVLSATMDSITEQMIFY